VAHALVANVWLLPTGGTDHRLSWSVTLRKTTMVFKRGLSDRRQKAIVCPTLT